MTPFWENLDKIGIVLGIIGFNILDGWMLWKMWHISEDIEETQEDVEDIKEDLEED